MIELSSKKFLLGCGVLALALLAAGRSYPLPTWVLAAEVLSTVAALFVFGSIRYRLDKNALTYGAGLVIGATFFGGWWPSSALRPDFQARGIGALWDFIARHCLTLGGLDRLVHADTMLFLLGLTFFVACVSQTRLLETASMAVLRRSRGDVWVTVTLLAGLVAVCSGILDGVSMIGLMIRTLVIILFLAKATDDSVEYVVMVSTVVTTVCGMWLAYGEPPNLIMKANLHPHLDDAFFLRYCLPIAAGSAILVAWDLRKKLEGRRVELEKLDFLDLHTADVRFFQASRHGKVLIPLEFALEHESALGAQHKDVLKRLHAGEPLGRAMIHENVPRPARLALLGEYLSEEFAEPLDDLYAGTSGEEAARAELRLTALLEEASRRRFRAQIIGMLAFAPFIAFLVWHALDHRVPLFASSFAGFAAILPAIFAISPMRSLALREARHEFAEYLFLIPLFLSITFLQISGFFDDTALLLRGAIEVSGAAHVAVGQFAVMTFLSALLDNNVVADFAGRSISGLGTGLIHLFAMAQIAGYAAGGCWTHIGSAQSVVAYSFIRREVDAEFTPLRWIKMMTPLLLRICVLTILIIYAQAWFLSRSLH